MKYLFTILLLCQSVYGQVVLQNAKIQNAVLGQPIASGGGGSGWTLVGSGVVASSVNGSDVTTGTYNTSVASFIVIVESANNASFTPSDSKGNTWVKAVSSVSFAGEQSSIWYCSSPTTDPSQTFSVTGANQPSIAVFAFSGGGGGILDQSTSGFNNGSATTVQPGSITPTTTLQLIITGTANLSTSTPTVNSGFNTPLVAGWTTGVSIGIGGSWLVQNPAAAINPTWTTSGAVDATATIASFK